MNYFILSFLNIILFIPNGLSNYNDFVQCIAVKITIEDALFANIFHPTYKF